MSRVAQRFFVQLSAGVFEWTRWLEMSEGSVWPHTKVEYAHSEESVERMAKALGPLAALLHEDAVGSHSAKQPDSQPVFAINRSVITLGDLREARAALAAYRGEQA